MYHETLVNVVCLLKCFSLTLGLFGHLTASQVNKVYLA